MSENWVRLAATKASASEQIANTTASAASARTESSPGPRLVEDSARHDRLQRRGRHGPDDQEAACVEQVVLRGRGENDEPASLRAVPWAHALEQFVVPEPGPDQPDDGRGEQAGDEAGTTTSGWPGNATAVATSTTGLMAGAERRNVRAAAGGAPRAQPSGDRHRAALAARQGDAGDRGAPARRGRAGRAGGAAAGRRGRRPRWPR